MDTTVAQASGVDVFTAATRAGSLHEAARIYAAAGIPVFPCVPGGKPPLTGRGFHNASVELAQVDEWWSERPTANVGIPTGAASGFEVVDIDVHGQSNGYASFLSAWRADLLHGWMWAVGTPSGGLHVYYPHADGVEQRSWTTQAHVDFRGDGGYVVAPPSWVNLEGGKSRPYVIRTTSAHEPHAIDAGALRAHLTPPRPVPAERPVRFGEVRPEFLAVWVAKRPEGSRNSGLYWAACEMARRGYSSGDALDSLGPAAQHAGLDDREIERTVASAFRKAKHAAAPVQAQASSLTSSEGVAL